MHLVVRRILGAALLVVALLAAFVGGTLGLLGTAVATDLVPVFTAVGLVTSLCCAYLVSWLAFKLLRDQQRVLSALIATGVLGVIVVTTAVMTIFNPMPYPKRGPTPANVKFWRLPTGSRIAYTHLPARPPGQKDPVIFLHGGPGTPTGGMPDAGTALAAQGFEVYSYDQVGGGRSSRLQEVTKYTVARQVADLDAIRKRIGAPRLILIGDSWGGTLAAAYMAAHPGRVAKAVFNSPGEIWKPAYPHGTGHLDAHLTKAQKTRAEAAITRPRMLAAIALLGVNPDAAHALVPDDEADWALRRYMVAAKDATVCPGGPPAQVHDNWPGFYVNQMTVADTSEVPDPRPRLRQEHVPALVLRGQCDFIDWNVTHEYATVLPDATFVYVKGAGHGISREQPALFQALVTNFLTGKPLPHP